MQAGPVNPSQTAVSSAHPLLLVAAASVSLFSLAGVGFLAGWLPGPGMKDAAPARLLSAPAAAQTSIQKRVSVPQVKARTVAKSDEPPPVGVRRDVPEPIATVPATEISHPGTSGAASPAPTYGVTFPQPVDRVAAPTPAVCKECGVVETVREIAVEPKASGGGAIAGGLVGGLIANQIGKGAARSIATVIGAASGAYAGNYLEKSIKQTKSYEVLVRFEDGSTQTFSTESAPAWRSGDRVRLQNGLLTMGGGRSNGNPGMI